MGGKSKKI